MGSPEKRLEAHEVRCPRCGARVTPSALTGMPPHFPFCNRRCRMADLDRWFTGDYRIPSDPEPDERG